MSKKPAIILHTKNEMHEFEAVWTIENFLMHPSLRRDVTIESPPFSSVETKGKIEWVLLLNPTMHKRRRYETKTAIGVCLKLTKLSDTIEQLLVNFRVALMDATGTAHKTWQGSRCFCQVEGYEGAPELFNLEDVQDPENGLLKDGILTIECHVDATFKYKHVEKTAETYENVSVSTLTEMLEEEIYTDVVLRTEGLELNCHKSVLSTRSKYFRAMFSNDMKESRENSVDLSQEMDAAELKDLVNFIYTGKADNLNKTCRNLYHVADVYGMDSLKQVCEKELIKKITPESAVELLVFAEQNGAHQLRKETAKRIYELS